MQNDLLEFVCKIKIISNHVPALMLGIKDMNSDIIYFSDSHAAFLGFSASDIIGKKTNQQLYDNKDINKILFDEDRQVISDKKTIHLLKVHKVAGILKPHICIKYPILNKKKVIGILFQSIEISMHNLGQYVIDAQKYQKKTLSQEVFLPKLTRREQQVIYLFLHNLTSQEIATAIGQIEDKKISKSAIDNLFNDQLYVKFNVHNRNALLDKLKKVGLTDSIPSSLLSSGSSVIFSD